MNLAQRHAVISRYVTALRTVADTVVDGVAVRALLHHDATDLWASSEVRESSTWRDASQYDQISALIGHGDAAQPGAPGRGRHLRRAGAAWLRSLLHALRPHRTASLDAEVVFVGYWPTGTVVARSDPSAWTSPYFGRLPDELRRAGISVGYLHVHADGPVTMPPRGVRRRLGWLGNGGVRHQLLADRHGVVAWWRAVRTWLRLARRAPGAREIGERLPSEGDARRLWGWWARKYEGSVFGSHAVRSSLLAEHSRAVVEGNPRTRLWIVAFEGQSWESCLARQLDAHGAAWLPYLHTMMRPWDLRAHTFLAEHTPRYLAVHGAHDRAELAGYGSTIVEVEALRYQHLANRDIDGVRTSPDDVPTWLVVGGADCAASQQELQRFLVAVARRGAGRRIVVKWHPQCTAPAPDAAFVVTDRPLREVFRGANAAFMVGSAAPLDAYLAGIPSCSLASMSGLSTTPVEEDDFFHVAVDADDAVSWLSVADSRRNDDPPVRRYFIVDASLARWRGVVDGYVNPR